MASLPSLPHPCSPHRIDDNIEESLTNIESARSALLRHLNQISSNKWLMIKIFAILIFFMMLDLAISRKGGIGIDIGICMISGAFRVVDAHVQGGMVGDLSFMLPEFMQVGDLTSGLRLITKAAFENSKDGLRKGASTFKSF
ncbi:Equilibrative nucleotide transporter 2 [Camellia lanceoleosa]|uniref:Equilibrative nucleotide transporter 2 n=1 Tax=Camellia lanceoleosa TaxID=1840588 RepID=A0ACC0GLS9_9ERIC|nr:Equilibrative nucleotide transporter 2 [Camellia lanceoleosa]